jgi:hypothetical protein
MGVRALVLSSTAAIAGAAILCSCGSSPAPAVTTVPTSRLSSPSQSPAPAALDTCLPGRWKSTMVSTSVTISNSSVALAGGAGEVLVIAPSGTISTDDSNTAALTGTASDGTAYKVTQTGFGNGTIRSANGKITVTLAQPNTLFVSLYKNGVETQSQQPGSASDFYMCTAGMSLVVTSPGGTVVKYVPG